MSTRKFIIPLFFLNLGSIYTSQAADFPISRFGAIANSPTNASTAIQKAIDAAFEAGGGRVVFEPGSYTTSTFYLKSNVTLFFENGALLKASQNVADYKATKGIFSTETDVPSLIMADRVQNICIEGMGIIDGQAQHEWAPLREVDRFIEKETEIARNAGVEMKRAYALDPKVCLFYITNAQNVNLRQLTIKNSPNWAVHFANCQDVLIQGIRLFSSLDKGVNSDGLDMDGCRNVRISDCHIETGDDAICLKSTNKNGVFYACENITVTNCTLISTSTALKIGTESHGDFRNIVFSNSAIMNTNRGIGIFVRDGAHVDGVIFSNLTISCRRKHFNWWGDGDPIRFVLLKRRPDSRLGSIRNVLVSNVIAKGQGSSLVAGFEGDEQTPPRDLENICFDQVQIEMEAEELPDKRSMEVLTIRNTSGLRLLGGNLSFAGTQSEKSWSHVMSIKKSKDIEVSQLQLKTKEEIKAAPLAIFDASRANFTGLAISGNAGPALLISGSSCSDVNISKGFGALGSSAVSFSSGAKKTSLKFWP